MNRRALIVGVIAAVIGTAIWFLILHDRAVAPSVEHVPRPGSSGSVERNQSAIVSETIAGTGSFGDLMGLGRDLVCDFTYVAEQMGGAIVGTVKVSGSNLRSDFKMQEGGQTYDAHLIQSGQYAYSWAESGVGVVAVRMNTNDVAGGQRPVVMDEDVAYECNAWTVDMSAFVPPSDLDFVEANEVGRNPGSAPIG